MEVLTLPIWKTLDMPGGLGNLSKKHHAGMLDELLSFVENWGVAHLIAIA